MSEAPLQLIIAAFEEEAGAEEALKTLGEIVCDCRSSQSARSRNPPGYEI